MRYDENQTKYSPSPRLSSSIQSISIAGGSGEALEARGEEIRWRRMFAEEPPSGGEEAMLGGLLRERGRGSNGRIVDGRGPGVDGWR